MDEPQQGEGMERRNLRKLNTATRTFPPSVDLSASFVHIHSLITFEMTNRRGPKAKKLKTVNELHDIYNPEHVVLLSSLNSKTRRISRSNKGIR